MVERGTALNGRDEHRRTSIRRLLEKDYNTSLLRRSSVYDQEQKRLNFPWHLNP
jgi:hypothetical protein